MAGARLVDDEGNLRRELARRRVFVFFSVFTLLALGNTVMEESDMFMHALDDYGTVAIVAITLILLAIWWKKQTLNDLRKQHSIITGLFVMSLLLTFYAFSVEIGDPADFGNEIPSLILIILIILNKFL